MYLGINTVLSGTAYIAGAKDGIVTALGKPASRRVWLLDAQTMEIARVATSLPNGHYIFAGLNHDSEYLVMARDYKKEFEPFAWDYVKPADDLTVAEQQALWTSWQTN
ncbi:hypothetical protein FQV37_2547 [Psychrobacter nivimaris]|uniref:Uncharacterized protein n=1 Tax=Psychrobacter nivimaris TaxID=281738 RepID=A0A6N7C2F1_9GAMM|nr:hypothetical protein [Psychrobacter nivimaris]KAF0569522.1 hypothetical protein FQV37_2547 [Psychrobacter nivimaris]